MSMMDGDFDAWFQTLSPDDQMFILQQLGLADANEVPIGFDGAYAPSLDDQAYALSSFGGYPSDYNTKGQPLPFGLDQQGQVLTQQKNRNALLADNITGALAGAGAYDVGAFTPTYKFDGPVVSQPGRDMAGYYAQMGGGGFQSMIAEAILAGDDPSTAVSKAITLASLPDSDSLTPEMRAQRDALVMSLQPARASGGTTLPSEQGDLTDTQKFAQQYDVQALYDFANNLGAEIAKDPSAAAGYADPATGTIYQNAPEEVWSGAAQKYLDLGLPFPTARYTDEAYGQGPLDPMYDAAVADAQERANRATAAAPSAGAINDMEALLAQYQQDLNAYDEVNPTFMEPGTFPQAQRSARARELRGDGNNVRQIGGQPGSGQPMTDEEAATLGAPRPAGPSFWLGKGGKMYQGDAGAGIKDALLNFDFTGMANALVAQGGAETGSAGRLTRDVVNRQRGKREDARLARSAAMDSRITRSRAQAATMGDLGARMALNDQGRTPLQDAMMQRLLANRAQGLY